MNIQKQLKKLSAGTGIPLRELERICLRAGAELMANGKLVIQATPTEPPKASR